MLYILFIYLFIIYITIYRLHGQFKYVDKRYGTFFRDNPFKDSPHLSFGCNASEARHKSCPLRVVSKAEEGKGQALLEGHGGGVELISVSACGQDAATQTIEFPSSAVTDKSAFTLHIMLHVNRP